MFQPRGAAGLDTANDAPPHVVIVTLIAVLDLLSAYGVWRRQRWGVVLTIVLRATDSLLALLGIFFAPTPLLWFSATGGVVISILIIVLLLWRRPNIISA